MRTETFKIPSSNDRVEIFGKAYFPETEVGNVKAALQILHGYAEHIEVYDDFMGEMCEQGYIVFGHDHIGHGHSINSEDEKMDFLDQHALPHLLQDCINIKNKVIHEVYPDLLREISQVRTLSQDLPVHLLGHSMGSLMTRCLILKPDNPWSKVVVMATGDVPQNEVEVNKKVLETLINLFTGSRKNVLVNYLGLGKYNNPFITEIDPVAWTNTQKEMREQKAHDPLRGSLGSLNTFYVLNEMMEMSHDEEKLSKMNKGQNVFFMSGAEDSFGGFGESVKRVYTQFISVGMQNTKIKLYPEVRHELLFDSCRAEVIQDILDFFQES